MPTAQGIAKKTVIAKQSALGTPVVGAGGQTLRRVTSTFQLERDTYENNEIVSHQQSTGASYGLKKPGGKLSGLVSPGTYKLLFAAALRKDFVAGATTGALIVVTAATTSGVQGTFTRSTGSYLTDGLKIGDVGRWGGWAGGSATNNNGANMMIIALTATVMTVTRFDSVAIVSDAAGDSVTFTVVGKKALVPLTGHTDDYFTIEEFYPAPMSKSEIYNDCKVGKIDLSLPATGNATLSVDFMGLSRTLSAAQVLTSPAAETVTPVLSALNGTVWIAGAAYTITGINLSIDGGISQGEAEIGSNSSSDLQKGRIKISGSFTALFKDTVIQALYDAQSVTSIVIILLDSTAVTASFLALTMGRIKIMGDAPDDGEKQIVRTYAFTAELNSAGGAALANDQTILTVQDSDA